MAVDNKNVTVAKAAIGGAIYRAPMGTTLPTDASTALANAFICMGYASDSGLVNGSSMESSDIKAWGGDIVLTPVSGRTDTFKVTLIEAKNADVLKVVHGDGNVTTATKNNIEGGKITVAVKAEEQDYYVWAVDMILSNNAIKRIVIPKGKVTEVGDVTYKDDEAVGYEITITASPDSSGVYHYEYIETTLSGTGTGT